ncbi:MAG TPA: Ig-like domain-containing protein, partial [Verrucomicrobiae bacterium]|nr:Ig-like domain-containing protein [Verrucomicrobiae bacterium]
PAAGAETNQPPVAAFTWTPPQPTTLSEISFDASGSSDDQDSVAVLNYRWDWESDGVWDTGFTNSPVAMKQFYLAGTKRVRLEVKDRFGEVNQVEHEVSVTHENDPGQPGGGNPAYEMQFAAADLVFDELRGRLFATDYTGKRLVSLNLTNGITDRTWTFADSPESVTITPNGESLYVALLKRPHSGYYFSTHTSRIAEINLPAMQKTREVEIAHDPADIVATDNGMVVVTGGSDQHTELAVVSATTGATLGSGPIYMGARLAMHPSQAAVYAGDVGLSPADFRRFSFNPLTGSMGGHWDSRYHGEHNLGYQPWITPEGARIISRGGDVFTSSATQGNDLEYLSTFTSHPFEDLAFDTANLAVFTVGAGTQGSPGQLDYYHLSQLGHARSIPLVFSPQRVFASPDSLWLVSITSSNTVVTRMDNPAVGAAENVAPMPAFSWTPPAPDTFDHLTFDAGGTADESPTTLLYRWDWEADGTWDTSFSTNSTVSSRFFVAGTRNVRLQVMDRFGATADVTHAVTVTQGTDPGQPGNGNPAFELDFAPVAAAFDRLAPRLFAADAASRRIAWVDLNTGLITRQFAMEHIPEALAITPDGSRLYAAMIVQPHQYYTGGQPHRGMVAEFDLTLNLLTRVVEVSIDPAHLAATDAGTLVMTDGSDQWTTIGAFSAVTGAGSHAAGNIYMGAQLLMMPGQTVFYAVDFQGHRYELDQGTQTLTRRWTNPTSSPAGRMFALPAGDRFYTTQGRVYSSSPLQQFDMQQIGVLPVEYFADSAYATNRHLIITLGGSSLSFINPTNYSLVATSQVPGSGQFVGTLGEYVYAVSVEGTNSVITRKRFPALNAEENLPPTITLDAPTNNEVLALHAPLFLRASPEDEDGSITNVTFFVDGLAVGSVSDAPWSSQHTISVAGVHQIIAVAADNFGRTATSAVASVTLSLPPSVYLTSPTSLQSIAMPESILLAAEASDADGIARVDFFVDGQLVGASTSAPYRIEIPTLPAGVYQFRAVAIDQLGL